MTENSRIVGAIKGQVSKFSGIISKGLPKAKQRLIREMIYGIQAGKDVKLSSVAPTLNECTPLIKTEDRLSRNLDDQNFTVKINDQICRLGSRNVLDDMVIAIDPGDIRKRYASKMECLCKIHDGSAHEIGEGYWLAKAVAADIEHKKVIPLYLEAYSQEAKDFKSENDQLFKLIDAVGAHIGDKGTYAIDRGGDSSTTSSLKGKENASSSASRRRETSFIKGRRRTAPLWLPRFPALTRPPSSGTKREKSRRRRSYTMPPA